MGEIKMNEEEGILFGLLTAQCLQIEKVISEPIDPSDWSQIETKLNLLLCLLSLPSVMIQNAVLLYDGCKGKAAMKIVGDDRFVNAKQDIQRKYLEGLLSEANGLYCRVERCCKNLTESIEGLRTILSFEKEQIRNNVFQNSVTT